MKYLAIYSINGAKMAYAFTTSGQAVDYINACSEKAGSHLHSMRAIVRGKKYVMELNNGSTFDVSVEEFPEESVRYDVIYVKNGKRVEVRRFTRRRYAVEYAHRVLDRLGYNYETKEDKEACWKVDDPADNLQVELDMQLVILGGKSTKGDYGILGLSDTATETEVKHAFHQLAIKYHPDHGGDPEKFEQIHAAYERIQAGHPRRGSSRQVSVAYDNIDMRYFFSSVNVAISGAQTSAGRSFGLKKIGIGIILTLIGGSLSFISYSGAKPGGQYMVFTGLIVVGVYDILRGIWYLINPKAAFKTK